MRFVKMEMKLPVLLRKKSFKRYKKELYQGILIKVLFTPTHALSHKKCVLIF